MKIKRTLAALLLVVSVVTATTGCMKMDMSLKVNDQDKVSGSMVVGITKSLASMADPTSSSNLDTNNLLKDTKNVTVEKFDDGKYVGTRYKFSNLPLKQFAPTLGDTSSFGITRKGDNLVVSGKMDMGDGSTTDTSNPFAAQMAKAMAASFDIKISVTLPGEIKSTNGVTKGQTISWVGAMGKDLNMEAVSYAPLPKPINWALIGGITAGGLAILAAATLLILRQRKKSRATQDFEPFAPTQTEWF